MEKLKKRLNKKAKGFTLVELLVVIAIIAILSVTAYVALGGQTAKARNSRRLSDISTIQSALEIYFISHDNKYPANTATLVPTQINKLPLDPVTDADYKYTVGPSDKTFQLSAHLEDEAGGVANTAAVIGNGTNLITDGCTYTPTTGACNCGSTCIVTDGSPTCVPYCL
ncbi:type II secretion system GspH family protein [Patescibacteria group bacterium]|nr:type II secretion system GspH family protein [Patescibacteria group bacterium]MBU1016235.1 type II secretion system GspH family protein [Patescibacteria group bacterium]